MATAETGDVVTLYIDSTGGTAIAMASQRDVTLSYDIDEIDTTAKGDGTRTNTPGKIKISGSIEGLYAHSDASITRLLTVVEAGNQVVLSYYRSGSLYKNATCQITNLTLTHTDNEAATYSCDFVMDGALDTSAL